MIWTEPLAGATDVTRSVDWPPPELALEVTAGWLIVTMWWVAGMFPGTVL